MCVKCNFLAKNHKSKLQSCTLHIFIPTLRNDGIHKNFIHSLAIADSTGSPHSNDTRAVGSPHRNAGRNRGKGMGTGDICVLPDMRMKWSLTTPDRKSNGESNIKPMLVVRPRA